MALRISSPYGPRIDPVTHLAHVHQGVDLPMPIGSPVVASRAGVVARIDQDGVGKGEVNGNAVHIRDRAGYLWSYLHLSRMLVWPGLTVPQSALIGAVGSTGRSTGPHLHLQITAPNGQTLDPVPFFPPGTFTR